MLTFSVVINTLNRASLLGNTIEALMRLDYPAFEIIVVPGPCTDHTMDVINKYADKIKWAPCPEANLSMSRNIGIAMAAGDIVAFIDDDGVPEPKWLRHLAEAYTDPQVGAAGGYIRDHTGVTYQARAVVFNRYGDTESYSDMASVPLPTGSDGRFWALTGVNSSFRRMALMQAGGFDETYVYFLDETSVLIRLAEAGWAIRLVPAAEVHHKMAPSHIRTAKKIIKTMYYPARSKAYFCMRHAQPVYGMAAVADYLQRYRTEFAASQGWHLSHGNITKTEFDRVMEETDRGLKDGVFEAISRAPMLLQNNALPAPFKFVVPVCAPEKRLKVCLLSREYFPAIVGGIAVYTQALAKALASRGHEVSVVTQTSGHATVDFEDGIWVHRVPVQHHAGRTYPSLPDLAGPLRDALYSVYDEVKRIQSIRGLDIVSAPIWDLEGLACMADPTLTVCVSLHTTYKLSLPSRPEWRARADYYRDHIAKVIAAEETVLRTAPYLVSNAHNTTASLEECYGLYFASERLFTLPHSLPDLAEGITPRVADGVCRLLYVGRHEKRKGIDVLLAALPMVMANRPDVEIDIVGDDSQFVRGTTTYKEQFLAEYANAPWLKRVHFHGSVEGAALPGFYNNCDIFVAPSRFESFGLIYLEAMIFGKPCIGTLAGGIVDVVSNGQTGLLVAPEDVSGLAAAIIALINDAPRRQAMGQAGRQRYEKHFTMAALGAAAETMYRTMLAPLNTAMMQKTTA